MDFRQKTEKNKYPDLVKKNHRKPSLCKIFFNDEMLFKSFKRIKIL